MANETAARFRKRARECRELAAQVTDEAWLESLLTLAQDLEQEADQIELQATGESGS